VNLSQARQLAEQHLSQLSSEDQSLALFGDDMVDDRDWCYVFPWNTARYVESLNLDDSLGPGSGPLVVVKATGDIWMMGSALPPGDELATYEQEHGISQ
jgi:hypothetical protein